MSDAKTIPKKLDVCETLNKHKYRGCHMWESRNGLFWSSHSAHCLDRFEGEAVAEKLEREAKGA